MYRSILLVTLLASFLSAGPQQPREFYVVSEFFSDHGPAMYYRVHHAMPDGQDTRLRVVRVAPAEPLCQKKIIQAAEVLVRGVTPARLSGAINPCALSQATLDKAFAGNKGGGGFETISFGIVAKCGEHDVVLSLPVISDPDIKRIRRTHPAVARLWDLVGKLTNQISNKDIFHDRTDADDNLLQQAGQRLVPEMISGRYDPGLSAAHAGPLDFRRLLANYRGPVSQAETRRGPVPVLLNADKYRFTLYEPVKYLPLARAARVAGNVQLELQLNSETGEVVSAHAVSGPPLLRSPSEVGAKKWRFDPATGPVLSNVTIEFSLDCH